MPRQPLPPDDQSKAADASFLFGDEAPAAKSRPERSPRPGPIEGGYDLEGGDPIEDEAPPVPRAPIAPRTAKPKTKPKDEPSRPAEEARVDELWTRGAEWGPSLIPVGLVGVVAFVIFYILLTNGQFGTSLLALLVGGAVMLALAYPIFITLERPVRMTPEQAVKDYFGALSHYFPHYRRAWLLLSTPGKNDRDFTTLAEFRAFWKRRRAEILSNGGKPGAAMSVDVRDFKADKSAGKTAVDATFTVVVNSGGDASATTLDTIRVQMGLAKGSDNMWYLNSGKI